MMPQRTSVTTVVFVLLTIVTLSQNVQAFVPSSMISSSSSTKVATTVLYSEQQQPQPQPQLSQLSRTSFLTTTIVNAMGGLFLVTSTPQLAHAAKYGAFGSDSSTGSITKDSAEIDEELLKSNTVKDAISAIQKVRSAISTVQSTLASNPQSSVIATSMIGDPYKIRDSCNIINSIYDEDTQRYTDRLIRNIVQDLIEIDIAALQKEGISRSERRYQNVQNKLTKLAKNIDDFLALAA